MLEAIGRLVTARRRLVLVVALVAFAVAGALGGGVAERLSSGGFEDPGAESTRAEDLLRDHFGTGTPNVVLLVTADGGSVDDPAVAAAGQALTEELAAQPGVAEVASYWSLGNVPPLRNEDGDRALVVGRIEGDEDEVDERIAEISPRFARDDGTVTVEVGGFAEVFRQVGTTIEEDLRRAEMIALPVTLLLLIVVFGSVVAAALPLAVGALAVVGTMLVLSALAAVTQVSIFSLNLTTAMGLGLAIDYSLFVVSRFREELRRGAAPDDAVRTTVRTAGRTVAFSALTVAASLSALLVFPLAFLRSFAYAGVAVALIAAVAAVVVLPAILALLGRRVDALTLWHRRTPAEGEGMWHRLAVAVMRRPLPIATAVVVVLLVLGGPFLRIDFGLPDDRVLPADASSHQVSQVLRDEFASEEATALSVVAPGAGDPAAATGEIDAYAARLSAIPGVARVDAVTGSYILGRRVIEGGPASARFAADEGTWLSVVPNVEAYSDEGEDLVRAVRATDAPFEVLVAGPSAQLVDSKASLFGRLPLAVAVIAVVTFVLLFLLFGSVLVPVKALVLNVLSLSATFGAMVWVFQDGNLSGVLDFTPTGTVDTTTPILMFCIAFGLSMDYEVFLLSRIKEEHDRTGDDAGSVALGLERTGRIVTAAAVLIAVVLVAFATSRVTFIKLFGLGLTLAVLMDAFLIRATLVPAFMRLAGRANWWAPASLRRIHDRFGLRESAGEPAPAAPHEEEPVLVGSGR
ncbi:MAG TPA: MMPL family transporter [Acidimicrobiales bacterium]|jgi:RND superfamily putative drug exporter